MSLTREQLLGLATSRRKEKVHIPELGGDVYVRTITAAERERWEGSFDDGKGRPRGLVRATMVAYAACDERGQPLFGEDDIPTLATMPAPVMQALCDAALQLNKVSTADVEALEGESEASRSNGSATSSPSPSAG